MMWPWLNVSPTGTHFIRTRAFVSRCRSDSPSQTKRFDSPDDPAGPRVPREWERLKWVREDQGGKEAAEDQRATPSCSSLFLFSFWTAEMGLIPLLLLLSNCEASLSENIDPLLIKSNYIFPPLCRISGDFTVLHSGPPPASTPSTPLPLPLAPPPSGASATFIRHHKEILRRDCHMKAPPPQSAALWVRQHVWHRLSPHCWGSWSSFCHQLARVHAVSLSLPRGLL